MLSICFKIDCSFCLFPDARASCAFNSRTFISEPFVLSNSEAICEASSDFPADKSKDAFRILRSLSEASFAGIVSNNFIAPSISFLTRWLRSDSAKTMFAGLFSFSPFKYTDSTDTSFRSFVLWGNIWAEIKRAAQIKINFSAFNFSSMKIIV